MNINQKQKFFKSFDRIDKILREIETYYIMDESESEEEEEYNNEIIENNDIGNCVKCGVQIYHTAQECGKYYCKNWDYDKDQPKNYCGMCGEVINSETRQLCGKITCNNWDYVNNKRL